MYNIYQFYFFPCVSFFPLFFGLVFSFLASCALGGGRRRHHAEQLTGQVQYNDDLLSSLSASLNIIIPSRRDFGFYFSRCVLR